MNTTALTRCPGCSTVFRITADQLALREGQVRCGQCRAVFDANEHLLAEERVDATPATERDQPADVPSVETFDAPVAAETPTVETPAEATTADTPAAATNDEAPDDAAAAEATDEGASVEASDEGASVEASGEGATVETSGEGASVEASGEGATVEASDEVAAEETPVESAVTETPAEAAGQTDPSRAATRETTIVERQPRYEWKPRKPVRERPAVLYAGAALLLLVALALQLVLEFRDRLAAHAPFTRPILSSACSLIGCSLSPLHDAAALSIDASDLQADPAHKGLLQLTATIRNRAAYAIAYPYLELSLTDASDQVVARRALAPGEYVGGTANPGAGIPGNGESVVRLFIDASATTQAGYRLYLFYP
jgi:predicted Zn finger-like uncharacterized protein